MCDVGDVGCLASGMLGMCDARYVGCLGSEILRIWDVRDVGCSGRGMFGMWNVRDVVGFGCGMSDVECLPSCGMLVYKMPFFLIKYEVEILHNVKLS